ncbi:MAG TPA: ATP-binding cassette domain-containing protein, partial [Candidatus Acidoferrales bacterium]|nr:ATP-binding cassette domain-containing protein [Candidatus Acidoferrales bacterium]
MATGTSSSTGPLMNGTEQATVLVEARDLRKVYGSGSAEIIVLSGVNASVETGKLIAIVGPSGAGKSTFL